MSEYDKKKVEQNFVKFSRRNFEKPKNCRDVHQLRFYIDELTQLIQDWKGQFNYVPDRAYVLLSEYNYKMNRLTFEHFKNTY